jgi:3-oxoacid CoA-transferase subunit A
MSGKIFATADKALEGFLFDGMTLMSGGFGLVGIPEDLIAAVRRSGVRDLTIISNNCGAEGVGLWTLLENRQIRKMVSSYIGGNHLFAERLKAGDVELELTPQGTLAERVRAGGAGIPAFYTRTGVGTIIAEGKPSAMFEGQTYIRERWLRADVSLVKAWKADPAGNLQFRKTARNFNPVMATAGRVTVAEVEEMAPAGDLDPDTVHTPGIYVDRVILSHAPKRVENLTTRPRQAETA